MHYLTDLPRHHLDIMVTQSAAEDSKTLNSDLPNHHKVVARVYNEIQAFDGDSERMTSARKDYNVPVRYIGKRLNLNPLPWLHVYHSSDISMVSALQTS